MDFRLIAFDLDGTLLNSEKQVSDFTKTYLMELKRIGYKLAIVTGRNYSSAMKVTDGAEFADYLISDNGSKIFDLGAEKRIYAHEFTDEQVAGMLKLPMESIDYFDVCDDKGYWKFYPHEQVSCVDGVSVGGSEYFNQRGRIGHLSIHAYRDADLEGLGKKLQDLSLGVETMLMQNSFSDNLWLDVQPEGCRKSTGLWRLEKILDIPNEETMAFGDGLNDIDLLAEVGYGVAMLNALPSVKAVARAVTSYDNDHDGVARFMMERKFGER